MRQFMDENFLLTNEFARTLYHAHAAKMPVVDYHCHINPQEIYENRCFDNITQVWLGGDHYKWRLMRACGVPERLITGDAPDRDKFLAWASALPRAIGNPLYHWTHLELKRYFGYDGVLNAQSAEMVWELCNERLAQDGLRVRGIIEKSNVRVICTTDDPVDSLIWHEKIAEDATCPVRVLPAFRPDKAVNIDKAGFADYIAKLSDVSGIAIHGLETLREALRARLDFFDDHGCRASDHGLDAVVWQQADDAQVDAVLRAALAGETVSAHDAACYQSAMLLFFAREYARRGWVMQIHYGALRNANGRMFDRLGPDTGYDCIDTPQTARALCALLDSLEREGALPRTILYSLNPNDNPVLTAALGCFQHEGVRNYVQHGSAWWFNDTCRGMQNQLENLADMSVLGNFVGMLTDSRSFLSYTRHEYFRRVLCQLIGQWVENGEYPADEAYLGQMVEDISYNNAVAFFGF